MATLRPPPLRFPPPCSPQQQHDANAVAGDPNRYHINQAPSEGSPRPGRQRCPACQWEEDDGEAGAGLAYGDGHGDHGHGGSQRACQPHGGCPGQAWPHLRRPINRAVVCRGDFSSHEFSVILDNDLTLSTVLITTRAWGSNKCCFDFNS